MKENLVVRFIYEHGKNCGLNLLWTMHEMGMFPLEDLRDFYILLGLGGAIKDMEKFDSLYK